MMQIFMVNVRKEGDISTKTFASPAQWLAMAAVWHTAMPGAVT